MVALARELTKRGHSTTFAHHTDFAPLIARPDLEYIPLRSETYPAETFKNLLLRIDQVRGLRGMRALVDEFARSTAMLCEMLPDVLREIPADLIIGDWVEPAAGLVARRMSIPHISVAAALPLNFEPDVPPPFFGSAYGRKFWHRYRNIAVQYGSEAVQAPLREVIRSFAERWGLGPLSRMEQCASGYAQIAQITSALDYPRRSLIGCFHYCGPLRGTGGHPSQGTLQKTSKRAFASLGSLQGHRMDIFERIADAAVGCDLELTIAHGGRLGRDQIARLSAKGADVRDFVAYDDVFRQTDLAILHGGMNGVLDALANGVPIVAMPLAFEQPAIATRVRRAGAGLVCSPRASRRQIARAIQNVRLNPRFTEAAQLVAGEIRAAGGCGRAADIVEYVAKTGRPLLRADAIV